ncbi:hypothetical protein [Streptomyces sp. KR55]|uniref:hypothetical protein n=1 Tax=Streptomyces sp. KR55 TaxID=3457425 RepID=UPI003FD09A2F
MLRRVVIVTGLTALGVVGSVVPALADDPWTTVDCAQNPHPGCDLGAGDGGAQQPAPHSGGGGGVPGQRRGGGTGGGAPQPPRFANPDLNRAKCSYQRSDYQPSTVAPAAYVPTPSNRVPAVQPAVFRAYGPSAAARRVDDPQPGEDGAWYVYRCEAGGVRDAYYRPPVWIPDAQNPGGGGPQVDPAALAEQARDQLRLPSPKIETNPVDDQLVNLPTWLWLDRDDWGPVSATASVPGVSVTATARPTTVVWAMGDGSSVTCKGPGTPYAAGGNPKSSSPDCGHTYRSSLADRPNQAYAVSATVHWTVTWAGAGESGTFPDLTTTSTAAFRVAESQALNTGG